MQVLPHNQLFYFRISFSTKHITFGVQIYVYYNNMQYTRISKIIYKKGVDYQQYFVNFKGDNFYFNSFLLYQLLKLKIKQYLSKNKSITHITNHYRYYRQIVQQFLYLLHKSYLPKIISLYQHFFIQTEYAGFFEWFCNFIAKYGKKLQFFIFDPGSHTRTTCLPVSLAVYAQVCPCILKVQYNSILVLVIFLQVLLCFDFIDQYVHAYSNRKMKLHRLISMLYINIQDQLLYLSSYCHNLTINLIKFLFGYSKIIIIRK
eukprot:TRINITY_DN2865_c0_g1_i4.p1 TRINITY_DN2865_c0_g1~~TRINITY_DN2865_c0_g1_i4.p1  ORF type:complete len:260 (+),score=-33.52 TRINITY_DN2865_c0_g1_i4:638-1417(+)